MIHTNLRLWILIGVVLILSGCCSVPSYHPSFWNSAASVPPCPFSNTVQTCNNCYNYGNNKRTDTFAQPGRASGITLSGANMNCNDVRNAAVADGVELLPQSGVCPGKYDKVALVVDPGTDYHWYRQDKNGMWTHKPGGTQATNLDNSSNPISNPETADRCGGGLCYSDFCGYHCVCSDDDEGKGHEKIN
jgi:hypothetical protein